MRVYGVALALATSTFVCWPEVGRWPPDHPAYERMFVAIFFSWGLALYRGAKHPEASLALVDFTALQGLLHGGVMLADTLLGNAGHHGLWHLAGDVPLHLSAPLVLGRLRHRVSPYRLDLSVAEAVAFAMMFMVAVGVAFLRL
ncbi:MAG: hypothetical protein KJT01_02025 [Gemmatimonadetes bacterium]|nr:hypothetical protein [Gemmatimonadota bacterium]